MHNFFCNNLLMAAMLKKTIPSTVNSFCIAAMLSIALTACDSTMMVAGGAVVGSKMLAQERSMGETASDYKIYSLLTAKYMSEDFKSIFMDVNIEVNEGRVLLTGQTENPEYRMKAVELAWGISGVREVINEIGIQRQNSTIASIMGVGSDSWISAQIEARILAQTKLNTFNYNIETIDGVVYLFGIADSREELLMVQNIASTTSSVRKVVSHVRIKDSEIRKNSLMQQANLQLR